MKHSKSLFSLLLCVMMLAVAAFSTAASAETGTSEERDTRTEYVAVSPDETMKVVISLTGTREAPVELGQGAVSFLFQVVDMDQNECWFLIHTDREFLGDALLDNLLVTGSVSEEWGLMVESVLGEEIIWSSENPHYWSLFVNEEYAQLGVSFTPIEADTVYAFKAI